MIKVIWLAADASLRVSGVLLVIFSPAVGVSSANSSSQWEARASALRNVPTLLTSKKQGKYY
jgi:hypothetical protein